MLGAYAHEIIFLLEPYTYVYVKAILENCNDCGLMVNVIGRRQSLRDNDISEIS